MIRVTASGSLPALRARGQAHSGLNAGKFRRVRVRKGVLVKDGMIGAVEIADCLRDKGPEKCIERFERLHLVFIASVGSEFL